MQLAPDALALLDHGQLADALVQSSVLDRDGSVTGERLDQLQVGLAERSSVPPIGQVEVADRLAPNDDRHADEAVHRRVAGRKARATRVVGDVGDEVRATLPDDEAEQASATRRIADPRPLGGIEAAGDEAVDLALGIDDAKGGIARLGQVADAVDHELEDGLDVEHRGDGAGGDVEGRHALGHVTGLRASPRGIERQLDGAHRLLDLFVSAGQRARIDDQPTERHAAVVGRQGPRLERRPDRARPPPERADAQRQRRQRRGVDVEMGAGQAIRRGQSCQGALHVGASACRRRSGPGVQRVDPVMERQSTLGHAASVAGRSRRPNARRSRSVVGRRPRSVRPGRIGPEVTGRSDATAR